MSSHFLHLWHQVGSTVGWGVRKSHVSGTRLKHIPVSILWSVSISWLVPREWKLCPVVRVTDYIPKVYGIKIVFLYVPRRNFYHSQRLFEVRGNHHKPLHSSTFFASWIILQPLFNCLLCERGTQSSAVSYEGGVCARWCYRVLQSNKHPPSGQAMQRPALTCRMNRSDPRFTIRYLRKRVTRGSDSGYESLQYSRMSWIPRVR